MYERVLLKAVQVIIGWLNGISGCRIDISYIRSFDEGKSVLNLHHTAYTKKLAF